MGRGTERQLERGGASAGHHILASPRRYCGGSAPEPKRFSGNGKDPSAFTKWVRAMDSYRVVATPQLPPNEMALRVLDRMEGEALDEIEPLLDDYGIANFDHDDGIPRSPRRSSARRLRRSPRSIRSAAPTARACRSSPTASRDWSGA